MPSWMGGGGGALLWGCIAQCSLCYVYFSIKANKKVISGWFYTTRWDPFHVFEVNRYLTRM